MNSIISESYLLVDIVILKRFSIDYRHAQVDFPWFGIFEIRRALWHVMLAKVVAFDIL